MHSGSYDFVLIIKRVADKFEKRDSNCSGENTEKYRSFFVSINKNVGKK